MGKLLLASSVASVSFLAIGTNLAPNSPVFWLASAVSTYQIVRIGLVVLLLAQLLTRPPRHVILRFLTGAMAMAVGIWTLQQTYLYQMPALDTLAFMTASLAMGITALERQFTLRGMTGRQLTTAH